MSTPAQIEARIRAMTGKRVACVGDLLLDRFVYGSAHRVSREAPVVTLSATRRDTMLGACGNVARNVAALGGSPIIAALVGEDDVAAEASALAAEIGEAELIAVPGRPTPCKQRYVASGQQLLCVDQDPPGSISPDTEAALIRAAQRAIERTDIVILSDYGRGALTPSVIRAVIDAADGAGVRVVADPRGRDFTRYDGAFLLKPNAQELSLEAALPVEDDASTAAALTAVMGKLSRTANLLVTRGPKGMALLPRDGVISWHPSERRDVYDVSGAGDTTIAAIALSLAAGADLPEALGLANRAAGIAVSKVGTAAVRADEVVADARALNSAGAVASIEVACEHVSRWRADGARIGLTNGCFDILHAGHVSSLAQARSHCDRLVVAVNSDASVTRLKGPERPVNTQMDRARLLAALGMVDLVVIFDADTATDVVSAIRPDVYVKGGDYTPEDLPETPAVRAGGGEVVIAALEPGLSTTGILERMKSADS